jgi:hypothetical protein
LLALDSLCLSLGSTCGQLGLVCLLLLLGLGLLVLCILDRGSSGSSTSFWALGASLLDDVEGSTDNGTLVLDGTAGSLLGYLLTTEIYQQSLMILKFQ